MLITATGTGTTVGTAGEDEILGTVLADNIYGRASNDVIYGLEGADNLRGESGDDRLIGGAGNDFLDGGSGSDTMIGGADNDTYVVTEAGDLVIEDSDGGTDTVRSYLASYTLSDNVENLDLILGTGIEGIGNALDNSLRGNAGANILYGLDGSDRLNGLDGNDTLCGGSGALDILLGGTGSDSFVINASETLTTNAADQIGDLSFAEGDRIVLNGLGAGSSDAVLASYADIHAYVLSRSGVTASTTSTGRLILTIANGDHTQTVNITDPTAWSQFQAANPDPVASDDHAVTGENAAITVDVLANDHDDGPLTLTAATLLGGQGSIVVGASTIAFDPGTSFDYLAAGVSTDVAIAYQVTDAFGKTASAVLTVTVTGANDAATIAGTTTGTVTEDLAGITGGSLTVGDLDLGQAGVVAQSNVAGAYGTFSVAADGTWSYVLDEGRTATDNLMTGDSRSESFTVASIDGTASTTIVVNVLGHTDAFVLPGECTHEGDAADFDGFAGGALMASFSASALRLDNLVRGTAGADSLWSKAGDDTVYGKAGADLIDGGEGSDRLYGGSGADRIDGGQGNDTLWGGSGRDVLIGGQGDDVLVGGFASDTLTGGEGADRFVFTDGCDGLDVITDFQRGSDRIDLSGIGHRFAGPVEAHGFAAGQDLVFYHEGGNTIVLGDTDGNLNTAELMITLTGTIDLSIGSFIL